MNYADKLKDPRWQKKRLEIMLRDNFTCQVCKATDKSLHVHHKYYEPNKDPWDYSNDVLVTLCFECHELEEYDKVQVQEDLRYLLRQGFTYGHLVQYLAGLKPPSEYSNYDRVRFASFCAMVDENLKMMKDIIEDNLDFLAGQVSNE